MTPAALKVWRDLRINAQCHAIAAAVERSLAIDLPFVFALETSHAKDHAEKSQIYYEAAARLLNSYFPARGRRPQECYP